MDSGRDIRQGFAPDKRRVPLGDRALFLLRKLGQQHVGDDQSQDPVAEKFQPLVPDPGALQASMGQRALQKSAFVVV